MTENTAERLIRHVLGSLGIDIRHCQYLPQGIMPWSVLQANVMQATTCFHDGIPKAILQEADFVLHDPVAFHSTNRVLNAASDGGNTAIGRFLRRGEFPSRGFFLGLNDGDVLKRKSLEALPDTDNCQGARDRPPGSYPTRCLYRWGSRSRYDRSQ